MAVIDESRRVYQEDCQALSPSLRIRDEQRREHEDLEKYATTQKIINVDNGGLLT